MKVVCCAAGVALLVCPLAGIAEAKTPCSQTVSHALQPGSVLMIDSKPAGLQIVGSDQEAIRVSCTASSEDVARKVDLHYAPTSDGGRLSIKGAHLEHGNNDLEIRIEVPRRTRLSVRMFAGEVKVEEVKGDKDIEIGAGQITISSIHAGDYRSVDTSVTIGEIQARAFGADKGGFFRSFHRKSASGDYRLHAHVTTGEIDLIGHAEEAGEGAKPD